MYTLFAQQRHERLNPFPMHLVGELLLTHPMSPSDKANAVET